MGDVRSPREMRRAIEIERQQLTAAVGELRGELAEVRTRQLRVVKGLLAGALALFAAARLRRRRR